MKRLLSVLVALLVSAQMCWASAPGGGGAMSCSAINGYGGSIVGTDNGGLYYRTNDNYDWTRVGSIHGVITNNILSLCFGPSPFRAVAGGDGAIMATKQFGSSRSWQAAAVYDTNNNVISVTDVQQFKFTAVCYGQGPDSGRVFAAADWNAGSSNKRHVILVSNDTTAGNPLTFQMFASRGLPGHDDGYIVKLIEDPNQDGCNLTGKRRLYALFGRDNGGGGIQHLWRTLDLNSASATWAKISGTNGGPDFPVDFAMSARGGVGYPTDLLVSATSKWDNGQPGDQKGGSLWRYQCCEDHWARTKPYTEDNGGAVDTLVGAVFFEYTGNGSTAGREFCQSMLDVGTGCSNGSPHLGLWWRPSGNDTSYWRRASGDQSGSEVGWAACQQARGTFDGAIAKCLSRVNDAKGMPFMSACMPIWGGRQFAWQYDSTTSNGKWLRTFTSADGGSDFNSRSLDNCNATTISIDAASDVWVGFYDMGLWKYSGGAWHNQNGPSSDGTGGENDDLWGGSYSNNPGPTHYNYGGNISGMVWTSSTTALVTEGSSSKGSGSISTNGQTYAGYNYRLWRSTSSGGRDTWERYGDLPVNAGTGGMAIMLTGLWKDPLNGHLFVCVHMDSLQSNSFDDRVYVSTNSGANWIQEDLSLPTDGIQVVRTYGDTCVAGGWDGLWRRIGTTGTWTQITGTHGIPTYTPVSNTELDNVRKSLHRHRWLGVQDIYRNPFNAADWYVTVYSEDTGALQGGVYKSTNYGASYDLLSPSGRYTNRRSTVVDSCGLLIVSSGRGYSSPVRDFTSPGLETFNGSTWADAGTWGGTADLDSPEAHTLVRAPNLANSQFYYFFIVPGQGLWRESTLCGAGGGGCEDGCETERPFALGRPGEEPKRPRTMFSVAEARALVRDGKLELYDVSGRRARDFRAGVFFQLERNKAGVVTTRRTVLVTN